MRVLLSTLSNSRSLEECTKRYSPSRIFLFAGKEPTKRETVFLRKHRTKLFIINPFEIYSTTLGMIACARKNPGEHIVNITEGTNAMAAGAFIAAYYLGAKAVYVCKFRKGIIELPVPSCAVENNPKEEEFELLQYIAKPGSKVHFGRGQKSLFAYDAPFPLHGVSFSRYMHSLERMKLVELADCEAKVTDKGKIYLKMNEPLDIKSAISRGSDYE